VNSACGPRSSDKIGLLPHYSKFCYADYVPENTQRKISDRLERLRRRYPGRTEEELLQIKTFLDRYVQIALDIYLEMTEASSRETNPQIKKARN
jgi:hypothetical protein